MMMEEFEVNASEFLPLREVVYMTLRKAILTEKLRPGERLMENTIAQKLGVSRTPVREAIRMLGDEGLVDLIPRRGSQVAQISLQELKDVLEIRKSLEVLATERACEIMDEEEMYALRRAEERFDTAVRGCDPTELAEADVAFHDVIYTAAGNRRLLSILSNLREQMYRFRLEYLKQPDTLANLVEEHRAIVSAVERRDAEAAKALIIAHIDNQKTGISRMLAGKEA